MVKYKLKTGEEIYLDGYLMNALDTMIYNVKNDWDFLILITGDRQVRTGKSVIGITISAYLAERLNTPFTLNNIFFDSQTMINAAQKMPKHSILQYDEGREGLAASKTAQQVQKDLLDYFAECGQLNHIFVIVLPDFFELKENIAVGRSECLINVYRKGTELMKDIYGEGEKRAIVRFDRGYFEFFNRKRKQILYDKAKTTRRKSYGLIKADFRGRFTNNYAPVNEVAYRDKKSKSLARFKEKRADDLRFKKTDIFRDRIVLKLSNEGQGASQIRKELEIKYEYDISERQIYRILDKIKNQNFQKVQ